LKKKSQKRAGGVAQVVGSQFKSQYHKKSIPERRLKTEKNVLQKQRKPNYMLHRAKYFTDFLGGQVVLGLQPRPSCTLSYTPSPKAKYFLQFYYTLDFLIRRLISRDFKGYCVLFC
jgi:hypothetical protein